MGILPMFPGQRRQFGGLADEPLAHVYTGTMPVPPL
jgi:hypothetical protein